MKKKRNSGAGSVLVKLIVVVIILTVVGLLIAVPDWGKTSKPETFRTTYTANRGNLLIDILEPGNVEAASSLDVQSKVEGKTLLISIVEEGTIITEKDVEDKKVLIELDSSTLREQKNDQEILVEGAKSDFTDAKESYEIQKAQNESDIKAGDLKMQFAAMDLEKYVGKDVGSKLIKGEITDYMTALEVINVTCEALQKNQELQSEIDLAKEEIARASDTLDWTRTLEAQGYVTANDLKADELKLKRNEVALSQAVIAMELFREFDFPKMIAKLLSDYEEATRDLQRIEAKARSELAKAESLLNSKELTLKKEEETLVKLTQQIENCTIVATQPGLVVYAGDGHRDEEVKEGIEVRERQPLITIPNTSSMVVRSKVHESMITRVKEGLKAVITIDAIPDEVLEGEVQKVWVLPDAENRWLNPNLKVYRTDIKINDTNHRLKPGMSAQVRIIVDELKDVLMVPLQAIAGIGDDEIVFVTSPSGPVIKKVKTGDYNDSLVEIKEGLVEGDEVILDIGDLMAANKASAKKIEGMPQPRPTEAGDERPRDTGNGMRGARENGDS